MKVGKALQDRVHPFPQYCKTTTDPCPQEPHLTQLLNCPRGGDLTTVLSSLCQGLLQLPQLFLIRPMLQSTMDYQGRMAVEVNSGCLLSDFLSSLFFLRRRQRQEGNMREQYSFWR